MKTTYEFNTVDKEIKVVKHSWSEKIDITVSTQAGPILLTLSTQDLQDIKTIIEKILKD